MEGESKCAKALCDSRICQSMAAISLGSWEHIRTKSTPSSNKSAHAFVNGSVPSHLRRRIKRKKGTVRRHVQAEQERIGEEGRCKSPRRVHGAGLCAQMPTTAAETSEYVTAMGSLPALSSAEVEVASTSGCEQVSSNVGSSRIARMMEQKGTYKGSEVEWEIEASRVHWSEEGNATSDDDDENGESDLEVFQSLQEKWGSFFREQRDDCKVGEKIAEGGQAEIFKYTWTDYDGEKYDTVVKVFKEGWALRQLQKQWPLGMLENRQDGKGYTDCSCTIHAGLLLKNGRFAFKMTKYWGDLRKLIDMRMQHNGNQLPPFRDDEVRKILGYIAYGMEGLHKDKITHRDLKAANVLVNTHMGILDVMNTSSLGYTVADYECSVGVVGTRYWRAPEILHAVRTNNIKPHLFNEKSDVYSFAMTCYEVLTGCIPFEDLGAMDYDIVISGQRPELPSHVEPWLKTLLSRCWHPNPLERPCFQDIVSHFKDLLISHWERFRQKQSLVGKAETANLSKTTLSLLDVLRQRK